MVHPKNTFQSAPPCVLNKREKVAPSFVVIQSYLKRKYDINVNNSE